MYILGLFFYLSADILAEMCILWINVNLIHVLHSKTIVHLLKFLYIVQSHFCRKNCIMLRYISNDLKCKNAHLYISHLVYICVSTDTKTNMDDESWVSDPVQKHFLPILNEKMWLFMSASGFFNQGS